MYVIKIEMDDGDTYRGPFNTLPDAVRYMHDKCGTLFVGKVNRILILSLEDSGNCMDY